MRNGILLQQVNTDVIMVHHIKYFIDLGFTADNLQETIEVKLGDMITQNDRRCANVTTRYSDKGHYTCYDGKKYKLLEEEESYDNGSTWSLTAELDWEMQMIVIQHSVLKKGNISGN